MAKLFPFIRPKLSISQKTQILEMRRKFSSKKFLKENLLSNFKSWEVWLYIFVLIGLYLGQWFVFTERTINVFATSFLVGTGIVGGTIMILMVIKNQRSVVSFLIFIVLIKLLAFIFMLFNHDTLVIFGDNNKNQSEKDLLKSFTALPELIFLSISIMLTSTVTLVSLVYLLFVLIGLILNYLDYRVLRKIRKDRTRLWWFVGFTIFEVIFIFIIYMQINNFYFSFLKTLFDDAVNEITAGDPNLEIIHGLLNQAFVIVRLFLTFAWFPTMLLINNTRRTDMFMSKNIQIYFASQLVFLIQYVSFFVNESSELFSPSFIMAFIVFKLLNGIILFVITAKRNFLWSKKCQDNYIPLKILANSKVNVNVEIFWNNYRYRKFVKEQKRAEN